MGRKQVNAKRDAALYDAWMNLVSVCGTQKTGAGVYLANKYGVSRSAISMAIKREGERRAKSK